MSHFLEHVHEPAELLAESHRILKPGGRLVVLTPNSGSWGHLEYQGCWRGLEPPRHLHIFNSQSLDRLARQTGFGKVTISTTLRNGGKILLASRAIRRTGQFDPRARRDIVSRLWVTVMQLREWIAWKQNPDLGEELDMIAEK
jgi:SAM-dependent methyltransferase